MDNAAAIYKRLQPMEEKALTAAGLPRSEARFIHWVRPELLCEATFSEWPENGHVRQGSKMTGEMNQ
jgi:bifunctional non-homologous end joining protein LigD